MASFLKVVKKDTVLSTFVLLTAVNIKHKLLIQLCYPQLNYGKKF